MKRMRLLLAGVLMCASAVSEASAWADAPDLAALARAAAPMGDAPSPSLSLLAEAFTPLEALVGAMDPIDLFQWREQFYLRHGDRLLLLDATSVLMWAALPEANALLTAGAGESLVQRDLATGAVVREVALGGSLYLIAKTHHPDYVLVGLISDWTTGAALCLKLYRLKSGRLSDLDCAQWNYTISPSGEFLGQEGEVWRIAVEDGALEPVQGVPDSATWPSLQGATIGKAPRPLHFPRYRAEGHGWSQEESPPAAPAAEIDYRDPLPDAIRQAKAPDPDLLPLANPGAIEAINLGWNDAIAPNLAQSFTELKPDARDALERTLASARLQLYRVPVTGEQYLLAVQSGGAYYDQHLYRVTPSKPLREWSIEIPGDGAGFIGATPDGACLLFSSIPVYGEPSLVVLRARDFAPLTISELPAGWGPRRNQWAASPRGDRLAVAAPDGALWIYALDLKNARMTLRQRLGETPPGDQLAAPDTRPTTTRISSIAWLDEDSILIAHAGEGVTCLSLATRLPRWRHADPDLHGATALPGTGLAVLWSDAEVTLREARGGLPLGVPLPASGQVRHLAPTPEGGLRLHTEEGSWTRPLPDPPTTAQAASHILAHHLGLALEDGEVVRLLRLPERLGD